MYKSYYIKVDESPFENYLLKNLFTKETDSLNKFTEECKQKFEDKKQRIIATESQNILSECESNNVNLNAEQIQKDWFPEIEADVFISHSHQDIEIAEEFANWLYDKFNLKCFIDSLAWKYAEDLKQILNDEYPQNECGLFGNTENECGLFGNTENDYEKANNVATHVNIILAHALIQMIKKTECFFFLETKGSVIGPTEDAKETASPWIFHELAIVDIIKICEPFRKTVPKPERLPDVVLEGAVPPLKVSFQVPTSRLISLNAQKLQTWEEKAPNKEPLKALDILYQLYSHKK